MGIIKKSRMIYKLLIAVVFFSATFFVGNLAQAADNSVIGACAVANCDGTLSSVIHMSERINGPTAVILVVLVMPVVVMMI